MQKLLMPEDVADLLGVKVGTIYQWTHQDYIPHVKLGRLVRFRIQDIDRWLDQRASSGRKTRRFDISEMGI